jgi:hypothetical protein
MAAAMGHDKEALSTTNLTDGGLANVHLQSTIDDMRRPNRRNRWERLSSMQYFVRCRSVDRR